MAVFVSLMPIRFTAFFLSFPGHTFSSSAPALSIGLGHHVHLLRHHSFSSMST
jgi:hypothetical protein